MRTHTTAGRLASIALTLAILVAYIPAARAQGLHVESVRGSDIEAPAGQPLSLVFRLLNKTDLDRTVRGKVILPDGWRLLVPSSPLKVPTGGAETLILSVSIPVSVEAGNYSVVFRAESHGDDVVVAETEVAVAVTARRSIQLVTEEEPEFVPEGESATLRLRAINTGNATSHVNITAHGSGGVAVQADSKKLLLAPGESADVPIPFAGLTGGRGTITIKASIDEDPSKQVRRSSTIPVIPRGNRRAGYHHVPAKIQLRLPSDGLNPHPQLVVSASSPLFDEGNEQLDVFIRTPSQRTVGIFGAADLYRAAYYSDRLDVRLGDHVYAVSPLTTAGGSFFGGQSAVRIGAGEVGVVVNRSRWQFFDQSQQAAYVRYGDASASQTSLHVLNRTGIDAGQIASVRSRHHPHEMLQFDAEAGYGWMESDNGSARRIRIGGESRRLDYLLQHEHAGLDFPSSRRGRDLNSARLTWKPTESAHVYGYYLTSANEYPGVNQSSFGRSTARLGGRYQWDVGEARVGFGGRVERVAQESSTQDASTGSIAQSVRLEGRFGYGALGVNSSVEMGSLDDDWIGQKRPFRELMVQASYQPSSSHGYSLFLHHFDGARMYSRADYRNVTLNASGYYRPLPQTLFRVRSGLGLSRISDWERGYVVRGDVEHRLSNGHSIEFSVLGQKFLGVKLSRTLFLLSYTVPLNIPATQSRVDGRLVGTIVRAGENEPVANLRVLLGDRISLTDRDGRFEFAGLKPGAYRLSLSRGDLGLNTVPVQNLPMYLSIAAGEQKTLDLEVTAGASVSGRVNLYAFASEGHLAADTSIVLKGGLRNVLLELVRDGIRYQQVANRIGEFTFAGLTPGRWELRVISTSVPTEHAANPRTAVLELAPGEKRELGIDVVPKRRRIRFVPTDQE